MTLSQPQVPHDRRDQLDQIVSGLLPGERVLAVYDAIGAGTGFLGLTDRRVIIQDKSFVGKKTAITSIPYSRISSVSVVSNKSWAGSFFSTGSIAIHVGAHTYEVDFRGDEKSRYAHNLILHHIAGS
jgi:Bacterial PH domain